MLTVEYRICMPLEVSEYRIAQLYMLQVRIRLFSLLHFFFRFPRWLLRRLLNQTVQIVTKGPPCWLRSIGSLCPLLLRNIELLNCTWYRWGLVWFSGTCWDYVHHCFRQQRYCHCHLKNSINTCICMQCHMIIPDYSLRIQFCRTKYLWTLVIRRCIL